MSNLNQQLEQKKDLMPARSALKTVYDLIEQNKAQIARALPQQFNVERFSRVLQNCVRSNPALLECSQASLIGAMMMSAQLGLEPGVLGHCYLVPFKNKNGGKDVQFIVGYRGMIDLARRSGHIVSIYAHPVFEGDEFRLEYGLEEKCTHVPYFSREPAREKGEFRGAYCVANFKDGGRALLFMPKVEIDEHKKRSKASSSGPWVTDYEQMALKTVVRGIFKWLPVSIEAVRQIVGNDETTKTTLDVSMEEVPDSAIPDVFAEASVVEPVVETHAPPAEEKKADPQPTKESKGGLTVAQSKIASMPPSLRSSAMEALGISTALWQLTDAQCIAIEEKALELI